MADDEITAALAPVRERQAKRTWADPGTHAASAGDVPRLLAAVEAALKLHAPEPCTIYTSCTAHAITGPSGRDPYRFDKMAECPDCERRSVQVCSHDNCDSNDWPCPTYADLLAALTGKDKADG